MDYYKILELPRDATDDDIKKAYKKLARKYHPDKNHEQNASEKFKSVSEAYQLLSNPEQKRLYDDNESSQLSNETFHSDPLFATFQFQTPEEIFNQFFHDEQFFGNGNHGMSQTDTSTASHDPFYDKYERPTNTNDIFNAVNNTVSGASRMMSTTTEMVNGRKHTITKIIDVNGTRIIEDYGDGRKRVTLNGKEEISPMDDPQNQSYNMSTRPFTSIDISREYGVTFDHEDEHYEHQSAFRELCSRIFCCL